MKNDHRLSELESKLRAINDELVATIEQSIALREMLPEFETDQGLAELKSGLHFTEEKISDHQQSWGYEDGPSKGPGPRSAGGR